MIATPRYRALAVVFLAACVLASAVWLRGAEYDEQYTVFLLAGDARPAWPSSAFSVGSVSDRFHGVASPWRIAADLRKQDVHPPLYFWTVGAWSRIFGNTLVSLRLFSALCSLAALGMVGLIARRIRIPAFLAMLLTLGCYAFTYTGSVARGFALAQLLTLFAVFLALPRDAAGSEETSRQRANWARAASTGLFLGAASFSNYLAVFIAGPVLLYLAWRRWRDGVLASIGFGAFVAADLVFFFAQRESRQGQFPPFAWLDGLARLAKYGAASIAGGLPLYVPAALQAPAGAAIVITLAATALLVTIRWRHIASWPVRTLLLGAVIAMPAGLLLLGLIFDNTPIELRYLAFGVPYAALLVAGALASLPRRAAAICGGTVLALQAAGIAGLLTQPETMQPMRATAREAAAFAGTQTVVLLPRGDDGVGLVGSFLTEAPDNLHVRLVDRTTTVAELHQTEPRVALALLDRDPESHAALARLLAGFADDPCWRALPGGSNLIAFESTCGGNQWASSTASR